MSGIVQMLLAERGLGRAYMEGQSARLRRVPRYECPYDETTIEGKRWLYGWGVEDWAFVDMGTYVLSRHEIDPVARYKN